MASFIQCPKTNKLIPKDEYYAERSNGPIIVGDIEPLVSPIDGSHITTRNQLKAHNKRHGVTDARDYSAEWYEKKGRERERILTGNTENARRERIAALQHEMSKRGL